MNSRETAFIRQRLLRKCAALVIPGNGTFELTPRCNLTCRMCYIRMTPEEMKPIGRERSADEWIKLGREAADAGMVFLLLTGGEPTLRPDFSRIYQELSAMGLSISVNSNGTLLTDEIRKVWHDSPPSQVNITLYGICREDYGELCGNPDAYDRVCDALNWLHEEGILTRLNCTMNPGNLHRYDDFRKFAEERSLELRMTAYCFPPVRREEGCASCSEFVRLPPEAAGELIVRDLYAREGKNGILRSYADRTAPSMDSCEAECGAPISCMAGKSQFWITWDGRMLACGMLDTPCARPFENGFREAWEGLRKGCEMIRLCPDCVNCSDRRTCLNCAAVVYTETGVFDGKPEYMCRLNRAYLKTLEKAAVYLNK